MIKNHWLPVGGMLLLLGGVGVGPAQARPTGGEREARMGTLRGGAGGGTLPGPARTGVGSATPDRLPERPGREPDRSVRRRRRWWGRRGRRGGQRRGRREGQRRGRWGWRRKKVRGSRYGRGPSPKCWQRRGWQRWVAQELKQGGLPDARLEQRMRRLVESLGARPTASIPQACGEWASTKAAYRFFDNDRVTHAAILASHQEACWERVQEAGLVLVVQDTTSLDYTDHPDTEGLGPLEHPQRRGLLVHSALAVSLEGVPLGVLDQQVWARDPQKVGQSEQRKQRPIEEKESFKWLQGLRASLKDRPEAVCLVTVADREADVFDFFQEAEQQGTQVLVRGSWNRRLDTPQPDYLWDAVGRTPVRGRFTVEVERGPDREPRTASVTVRFAPVTIAPPKHRRREPGLKPLELYAIEVREEAPPPRVKEPLRWLLLTNRPVESFPQARECVRWYSLRWLVERYHYVLKSGCRIEERQLGTAARLQRCLGVYALIAWRLLWLTYQARATPEVPCSVALEPCEWQALYSFIHKTSIPPADPPSLSQAIRWIAQLGGFLGRKGDGQPGVKALWRGWQRLQDITETWRITHPPPDVGNA